MLSIFFAQMNVRHIPHFFMSFVYMHCLMTAYKRTAYIASCAVMGTKSDDYRFWLCMSKCGESVHIRLCEAVYNARKTRPDGGKPVHNSVHDVDRYANMHHVARIYSAMHIHLPRMQQNLKCVVLACATEKYIPFFANSIERAIAVQTNPTRRAVSRLQTD